MTRFRSIVRISAVLLGMVGIALVALLLVFNSAAATRFILQEVTNQLPELTFAQVDGSLAKGVQLDFHYENDNVNIDGQQVALDVRTGCLWRLELCINYLTLKSLSISIKDTPPSESTDPIELPDIIIPVLAKLQRFQLDQLVVSLVDEPVYEASNIGFSAEAIHHRISIQQLTVEDAWCQWEATGSIRLTRRYPLSVGLHCDTSIYPFSQLAAKADGDLDDLDIEVTTSGDLSARLEGNLKLLAEQLPLAFDFTLLREFTWQQEGTQLSVQDAHIQGKGSLDAVQLTLDSNLSSNVIAPPLHTRAQANLTPAAVDLQQLEITLPTGKIITRGNVQFSPLSWTAASTLQQLDFNQFAPGVSGQANGEINYDGRFIDQTLELNVNLDQLAGTLFDTPWELDGALELNQDQVSVHQLHLQQEQNQAKVNGILHLDGHNNDLQVNLDLNRIQQLLPQLQGDLKADLTVRGELQRPAVTGEFKAAQLHYDSYELEAVQGNINWQFLREAANQVKLRFSRLQVAEDFALNGKLDIDGNAADHLIKLTLDEQTGNQFQLSCHGKFGVQQQTIMLNQWQGRCEESHLRFASVEPAQHWSLEKDFTVAIEPQNQITISPFCYQYDGSELCLRNPVNGSPEEITPLLLQGKGLYLSWLQPWLPGGMELDGRLDIEANIVVLPKLSVTAEASSNDTVVTLLDNQKNPLPVALTSTQLNAQIDEKNAQLKWQVQSSMGSSEGDVSITDQQLAGAISIDQFDTDPISRWLLAQEGDHVEGAINAAFDLGGTLTSPTIDGHAEFSDGKVSTAMLPLPIESIAIRLDTSDRVAHLKGDFIVNKQPGNLDGTFNWQQEEWWCNVNFRSGLLAWEPMENSQIFLQPNIQFKIMPKELVISGEVVIPKAFVQLKALPEQAISSSSDAVIISDDEDTGEDLLIRSDLKLSLGKDVRVKGYGLETYLTGQLSITQQQADLLRSKGIIHLEEGTYTAYGQNLTITDGDVIFIDELDNPQLRLSAVRDNVSDNVVVGIRVTGRAQNPEITIFSIPELPQQEKFHYLITGRAPNTSAAESGNSVAAEAALSMALESRSGFTRKAGEKLGIKDLTLSAGSTENRSEVGLSGYITKDLMIRYGVGMFEAVNTVTLKYQIHKNLYAEIISGKSNAFDILWSFTRD